MKAIDYIAASIERACSMVEMTLADFSDADMLVRPVPNANHALWQLGHVVASNTRIGATLGAKLPDISAIASKFTKDSASKDDAGSFVSKAELLAALKMQSEIIASHVRKMSDEELSKPLEGPMAQRFPTVGHMALLVGSHYTMHLGQFQVIRRKLGKPVLF